MRKDRSWRGRQLCSYSQPCLHQTPDACFSQRQALAAPPDVSLCRLIFPQFWAPYNFCSLTFPSPYFFSLPPSIPFLLFFLPASLPPFLPPSIYSSSIFSFILSLSSFFTPSFPPSLPYFPSLWSSVGSCSQPYLFSSFFFSPGPIVKTSPIKILKRNHSCVPAFYHPYLMAVSTRKLKTGFPDSFFSRPQIVSPYSQNTHNNFLNRPTSNIEDREY